MYTHVQNEEKFQICSIIPRNTGEIIMKLGIYIGGYNANPTFVTISTIRHL